MFAGSATGPLEKEDQCLAMRASECEFGFDRVVARIDRQCETQTSEDGTHPAILSHGGRHDILEALVASNVHKAANEFEPEAMPLAVIPDDDGHFGFLCVVQFGQVCDRDDRSLSGTRVSPFSHEAHLAVIIAEQ